MYFLIGAQVVRFRDHPERSAGGLFFDHRECSGVVEPLREKRSVGAATASIVRSAGSRPRARELLDGTTGE